MFRKHAGLSAVILIMAIMTGCISSAPFQAAPSKPDKALLYIYRPESVISRGTQFSVVINDREIISPLINNAHIPVYVSPGNVKLVLQENKIPRGTLDTVILDNLEAGKEYYIKADPALFGAYKLIMMEDPAGKAEVGRTLFYRTGE